MLVETAPEIRVEEATSVEELESLQPEWAELWARCPDATPFQSPDWLVPWWKHLGRGELWVLALRQEECLVGVAPFFIHTLQDSAQRQVLLAGTGITDYLDVLLDPEAGSQGQAAIFAHLEANSGRWDLCDLQQLREDSPLLDRETPPDWTSQITVQEVCPVVALPENLEQLPRLLPAHMLAKLRYHRRRAERLAARMECAGPETFPALFEGFLQLHQARWTARGQGGVLADEPLREFHREAAERLLASGALRLYGLRIGDRLMASLYGFSHGRRTFYYLGGFDPEFASLSPGTLMIGHAIEQAIREGAGEFDFLRGRESYKYLWGAKGRLNYRRQLWRSRQQ